MLGPLVPTLGKRVLMGHTAEGWAGRARGRGAADCWLRASVSPCATWTTTPISLA